MHGAADAADAAEGLNKLQHKCSKSPPQLLQTNAIQRRAQPQVYDVLHKSLLTADALDLSDNI